MLLPALKLIGCAVIVITAAIHLLNSGYRDWNSGASGAYVLGLLLLFFLPDKIEDERVQSLKLKALTSAFFGGWGLVGVIRFALYLGAKPALPPTISAYDAMFMMLVIAHVLFHFWRFQDGRSVPAA